MCKQTVFCPILAAGNEEKETKVESAAAMGQLFSVA